MDRAIIVEDTLYDALQTNIDVLKKDWMAEGANTVHILTHPKGVHLDPEALKGKYKNIADLEGVLLLGELPVAMLQKDGMNSGNPFMSDSFFMDTLGVWSVGPRNIVTADAPQPPAIFLGRVMFAPETGWQQAAGGETLSEIDYYKRYLDKLHVFRSFSRYLLVSGIPYPQDHWSFPPFIRHGFKALLINNFASGPGEEYGSYLDIFTHLYPLENIERHCYVTRDEMLQMLTTASYDSVWVLAHSDSGGHQMAAGSVWNNCDYLQPGINVNFFFFEACAVGAVVWYDNYDPVNPGALKQTSDSMMSNILFAAQGGIATIGASFPVAFPNGTLFFDNLKTRPSFGKAHLDWLSTQYDFAAGNVFHFMNVFGDPFVSFNLLPSRTICVSRVSLYGTPGEAKIADLRKLRDEKLEKSAVGRSLVRSYYRFSRSIVKKSTTSRGIRFVARVLSLCAAWVMKDSRNK